jgi:hypothetical protein
MSLTVEETLLMGIESHQAGELKEAELKGFQWN